MHTVLVSRVPFYRYHYYYSFMSNCSAVELVLVSQRNSSSLQLVTLAGTRTSTQLQQPAVRFRRKAGTEEGKAVGVEQAEGDMRIN